MIDFVLMGVYISVFVVFGLGLRKLLKSNPSQARNKN